MDLAEIYKFFHIVAAMVWVGGSVLTQVFGARAGRSGDPARGIAFSKDAEVAGQVFGGAGFLVALFGVLLVLDVPAYEFEQLWIVIGIVGALIGFGLGIFFFGPQTRKLIGHFEANAMTAAGARVKRIVLVSQLELLMLLVVVWAMVAKPGL